jgi:hypothetical protein
MVQVTYNEKLASYQQYGMEQHGFELLCIIDGTTEKVYKFHIPIRCHNLLILVTITKCFFISSLKMFESIKVFLQNFYFVCLFRAVKLYRLLSKLGKKCSFPLIIIVKRFNV